MFKCRLCGGRHFGKCPIIHLIRAYGEAIARVVTAEPPKRTTPAKEG